MAHNRVRRARAARHRQTVDEQCLLCVGGVRATWARRVATVQRLPRPLAPRTRLACDLVLLHDAEAKLQTLDVGDGEDDLARPLDGQLEAAELRVRIVASKDPLAIDRLAKLPSLRAWVGGDLRAVEVSQVVFPRYPKDAIVFILVEAERLSEARLVAKQRDFCSAQV